MKKKKIVFCISTLSLMQSSVANEWCETFVLKQLCLTPLPGGELVEKIDTVRSRNMKLQPEAS